MTAPSPNRSLAVASLALSLSACTNMSGVGGDSKYACKAPEGVACESVSGTYANALRNNLPSQRMRPSSGVPTGESEAFPVNSTERTASSVAPRDATAGTPPGLLRSQARVLRLWIKPWEDADGDLHDQGYVYVQVDNGQWLIDHMRRQIREAYAPLTPPPKPAVGATAESIPGAGTLAAPTAPQRPPFTGAGANPVQ